jgi:hypothetical protein
VLLVKEKQLTGAKTAVPTGIAVKSARLSTGKAGTKMSAKNSPKSERNRMQKKKRKKMELFCRLGKKKENSKENRERRNKLS